jgi:sugar lactone lactonase YvrE
MKKYFGALTFKLLFLTYTFSYAQIITTVAGNSNAGFSGDGGQASVAEINYPTGVTPDANGNLYIADYGNNRIRKVNSSGVITTAAGNGLAAYSGDGGQATVAELNHPNGTAIDAFGNLYIADVFNNRIRKVSTLGIISTVVGNGAQGYSGDGAVAIAANLDHPSQVVLDAIGNIYFADQNNNVIRKVNTAGIINTIVGNGIPAYSGDGGLATACEINYSNGVALDAAGNVYISDQGNSRVRKVNTAGIINTIVGTGVMGFSGDGGQATIAKLTNPTAVSFGCDGNLYISDYGNNRIRKVNSLGIISTIAGNGTGAYSGDGGQGTAAEINTPIGIALDAVGNLYIADALNNRIRKVTNAEVGILTVNSPTICVGGTATLTANGVNTYTWSTGANTSSITVSPSSLSSYTVVGGTGICLNQAVATVSITPNPIINISGSNTICIGQSVVLTASGANTYTWNTGVNTNTITVSPLVLSSYTVTGAVSTCTNQAVITINVAPSSPTVTISGSNTICPGQNITLIANGASIYIWSTGDITQSVVLNPKVTTSYTVTGAINTCTSQAVAIVDINGVFNFTLPNIVTPNNDGINDGIDFGKYQFSVLQLEIYNRWGLKIFESNNPACIWKPTEDDGIYFYTAQYQIDCNNEIQGKSLKGFITVIR